jgi:hypothetical protein
MHRYKPWIALLFLPPHTHPPYGSFCLLPSDLVSLEASPLTSGRDITMGYHRRLWPYNVKELY